MVASATGLNVAITGPTGTFGFGLMPHLQADERIGRIVGVARRPFDPATQGWTKMEYRQGDVRDAGALEKAFAQAIVPGPLEPLGAGLLSLLKQSPIPVPVLAPSMPLQLVHEEDVGQAIALCVRGEGPPGAYNIAGDGVLSMSDLARELGLAPVPVPVGLVRRAAPRRRRPADAAVRAACGRVGGGCEPPGDHGHEHGKARAWLESTLHRARSSSRHVAAGLTDADNRGGVLRETCLRA
ncbi:MAG: hypothetical protein M3331_01055 [Actinomycetota bacterium]|nr:hypothetical protein [Actinomycetota bacterium]